MRYTMGVLVFLGTCLWSIPSWAQLPVTDVANLAVNTKQAISQAVTSVQSVLTVANQVLDLTPLDELIIAGASWASDISELTDTLATAQLLFADVSSLHRQLTTLLDLETAPNNTSELAVRIRELRGVMNTANLYAIRTQTLMMTLMRTLDHFTKLMAQLSTLVGNKQGHQVAVQANADISKTLKILEIQTAAFQRTQSLDKGLELLTMESLYKINQEIMADWPRRK